MLGKMSAVSGVAFVAQLNGYSNVKPLNVAIDDVFLKFRPKFLANGNELSKFLDR